MDDNGQSQHPVAAGNQTGVEAQQVEFAEIDQDSVDLLLRFLLGLLSLGGAELTQRLQEMQREISAGPAIDEAPGSVWSRTRRHRLRYLSVGLLMRGQRSVRNGARRSYELSVGTTRRILGSAYRMSDNRFTRPVRRPFEARILGLLERLAVITAEGELVTEQSKLLATGTSAELVQEVMDEVATNPELLSFVQGLLAGQGKGLATVVVDNSRSVSLTADDAAEGLLRWLLRRTPRRSLPPSPVEGELQNMYAAQAKVEGGMTDAT